MASPKKEGSDSPALVNASVAPQPDIAKATFVRSLTRAWVEMTARGTWLIPQVLLLPPDPQRHHRGPAGRLFLKGSAHASKVCPVRREGARAGGLKINI
jgi:hypothetical protein